MVKVLARITVKHTQEVVMEQVDLAEIRNFTFNIATGYWKKMKRTIIVCLCGCKHRSQHPSVLIKLMRYS